MDFVNCNNSVFLVRIVPRNTKSLFFSLAYQYHQFGFGSGEHRLAATSLERDCLVRLGTESATSDEDIISAASDLYKSVIKVYQEEGPVHIYGKRFAFHKTLQIIQRQSLHQTRFSGSAHYDCLLQRLSAPALQGHPPNSTSDPPPAKRSRIHHVVSLTNPTSC